MIWVCVILSVGLCFACFLLSQLYGTIQELEEHKNRNIQIVCDMRDERIDNQEKIRELEKVISQSEELMQEYDAVFDGLRKFTEKYPYPATKESQ